MNQHDDHCDSILDLATGYLDGRVEAPVRARVRDHLADCSSCLEQFRALRRLSRLSVNQPLTPPPHDLSDRVHRSLHERRNGTLATLGDSRRGAAGFLLRPGFLRVAAALVLLPSAAVVGFWVGRGNPEPTSTRSPDFVAGSSDSTNSGPPTSTMPVSANSGSQSAAAWKPYLDGGFDLARFTRAGRSVLGDVSVLNDVDPDMQLPLLASQIEYFDLAEQARRFAAVDAEHASPDIPDSVRSLAIFVGELSEEIESRPEAVRDRPGKLRSSTWLTALPRVAPVSRNADRADPSRLRFVVDVHGAHLQDRKKNSLVQLLNLKHAAVNGLHEDIAAYVYVNTIQHYELGNRDRVVLCDSFCEGSFCWVIADVLPEVGLEVMARPYRATVLHAIPEGLRLMPKSLRSFSTFHIPPAPTDIEGLLRRLLEENSLKIELTEPASTDDR